MAKSKVLVGMPKGLRIFFKSYEKALASGPKYEDVFKTRKPFNPRVPVQRAEAAPKPRPVVEDAIV